MLESSTRQERTGGNGVEPDRLDELEDAWKPERPTKERLKRIERSGPPESYPPPSTATLARNIAAWVKSNAWLFALFGLSTGSLVAFGGSLGEKLGLATKAELQAERAARDAKIAKLERQMKQQAATLRAECVGRADLDAVQSQVNGMDERVESVEVKKGKRRP